MDFQIQVKLTPTADWTNAGRVSTDRDKALRDASRMKEGILKINGLQKKILGLEEKRRQRNLLRLEKGLPALSEGNGHKTVSAYHAVAIRVVDENGKQI